MELPGDNKPLTEPELVQCVYLTGAEITAEHGVMRFVGWVEEDGECRVRIRYAIPMDIAREIHAEFRRRFLERNH
jgi:hypothetical protein